MSSKRLASVAAIRRRLVEQKEALERDVWGAQDWHAFQKLSGEYRLVCQLIEEMGKEGEEED